MEQYAKLCSAGFGGVEYLESLTLSELADWIDVCNAVTAERDKAIREARKNRRR